MTVLGLYPAALPVPAGATAGIDVSGHNSPGLVDATAPHIDWVSIKATEGASYFLAGDTSAHVERAQAHGLRWGLYHFARPDLRASPAAEVDWFLAAVETMTARHGPPTMRAMLDLETQAAPINAQAFAADWLAQVGAEVGHPPFWYTYTYWLRSHLDADGLAAWPLWLADYTRSRPALPSGVLDRVAIHQFTSTSALWGHLDLNVALRPELISPGPTPTTTGDDLDMATADDILQLLNRALNPIGHVDVWVLPSGRWATTALGAPAPVAGAQRALDNVPSLTGWMIETTTAVRQAAGDQPLEHRTAAEVVAAMRGELAAANGRVAELADLVRRALVTGGGGTSHTIDVRIHVVQPGDTVPSVAARLGVPVEHVARQAVDATPTAPGRQLVVGQVVHA